MKSFTTKDIADILKGRLIGDGTLTIRRVAHPADVQLESDLALAADPKLLPLLAQTVARAAVVSPDADLEPGQLDACIIVDRPRVALAHLTTLFEEPIHLPPGVHATACIGQNVEMGSNVAVGAFTYIGRDAVIGADTVIHPQAYIADGAVIGEACTIHAGVRIGPRVVLGSRCTVHYNTTIGADGFSYVTPHKGSVEQAKEGDLTASVTANNHDFLRIASLGGVIIGDDVEIGANTSIDSGTLLPTRVGNGTKIDNQVQIGHNVQVGRNVLLCGRAGLAGSCILGDRVVIGGASGVADHIKVDDDAIVMAMSGVAGNVGKGQVVGGAPAVSRERVSQNILNIGRMPQFLKKLDALAARLDMLEQKAKSD